MIHFQSRTTPGNAERLIPLVLAMAVTLAGCPDRDPETEDGASSVRIDDVQVEPRRPAAGEEATVSARLGNPTNEPRDPAVVRALVTALGGSAEEGAVVGEWAGPALGPAQSASTGGRISLPDTLQTGQYLLHLELVPPNRRRRRSRVSVATEFEVERLVPDLDVYRVEVSPRSASPGDQLDVVATVRNRGDAISLPTTATVYVGEDSRRRLTTDVRIGAVPLGPVTPGDRVELSVPITVSSGTQEGYHYVWVVLDERGAAGQTAEGLHDDEGRGRFRTRAARPGRTEARSDGDGEVSFAVPIQSAVLPNVPISAVFDHSEPGRFYCSGGCDGAVLAFDGSSGHVHFGTSGGVRPGYARDSQSSEFDFSGVFNYEGVGREGRTILEYDGHPGYDFKYGRETAIVAAAPGWLETPANDPVNGSPDRYNSMRIVHEGGFETWYLHALLPGECVGGCPGPPPRGQRRWVDRGEVIGRVGSTGIDPPAYHLHFEVRLQGVVIDPFGCAEEVAAVDPNGCTGRLWR